MEWRNYFNLMVESTWPGRECSTLGRAGLPGKERRRNRLSEAVRPTRFPKNPDQRLRFFFYDGLELRSDAVG